MRRRNIYIGILIIGVFLAGSVCAEEAEFAYDDHGKRDPLWRLVSPSGAIISYETDILVSDMILEGIIYGQGKNSLAIINGEIVEAGAKLGPYIVIAIEEKGVLLKKGQEKFVLNLKKEE
jgi:hypothetical protein